MISSRSLSSAAIVTVGLVLSWGRGWTAEPVAVVEPDETGPQFPTAGQSLFDELFATGRDVPYPFERLLDALNVLIAPATARTALFPLGRSLQRFAAHPDYFSSPRLVVAIDAEGAARGDLLLRDRLFLGYQPAADAVEIISYNEAAGRFEFQEIVGYGVRPVVEVRYAPREICLPCHQGHAPIFSRPLWSESNASPAIAAELSGLGRVYHGAPVRQGVDGLDDFDRSTDRANRIAVINRLWSDGCGIGRGGAECRAALLSAALQYRLSGARAEWRPSGGTAQAEQFHERVAALWPGGLGTPSPDLPNRDPLMALAAAGNADKILETDGPMNPETSRAILQQWSAGPEPSATFASAAREIASMFATSDITWLDRRLAGSTIGTRTASSTSCRLERVGRSDEQTELRFECGGLGDEFRLSGFFVAKGEAIEGGRIDSLSTGLGADVHRLAIVGGSIARERRPETFRLNLREAGAGLSARLLSGATITELVLRRYGSQGVAELETIEDLPALEAALRLLVSGGSDTLGPGPLRRRAVLAALDQALAGPAKED